MGSIDMINPLSTFLSSAVNKSQQHQDKNSLERNILENAEESNPGPLGGKQDCYPMCYAAPNCFAALLWHTELLIPVFVPSLFGLSIGFSLLITVRDLLSQTPGLRCFPESGDASLFSNLCCLLEPDITFSIKLIQYWLQDSVAFSR